MFRRVADLRPLSRTEGLRAEDADGGVLIYDEQDELVLSLNRSAAVVWRSSDGNRTIGSLVDVLTEELGEQADRDQVLVALDELATHGLIESGYDERDPAAARLSRRNFVRRAGVFAAVALGMPIVHRMATPDPAQAASSRKGPQQTGYTYCPDPKMFKGNRYLKKHPPPPYQGPCR
jgi:hypothetical protein